MTKSTLIITDINDNMRGRGSFFQNLKGYVEKYNVEVHALWITDDRQIPSTNILRIQLHIFSTTSIDLIVEEMPRDTEHPADAHVISFDKTIRTSTYSTARHISEWVKRQIGTQHTKTEHTTTEESSETYSVF